MLAICSDIDGTCPDTFRETHRFLNTVEETAAGPGIGLDIADSCWLYQPPARFRAGTEQFAYFADLSGAEPAPQCRELLHYVRQGWIDTLHTYGNFSDVGRATVPFHRRHAIDALKILAEHGAALRVWVNHGDERNRQNIGAKASMQGDNPEAPEYHADLLRAYGTEYLWAHGNTDRAGDAGAVHDYAMRDGGHMFGFHRFNWRRNMPDARRIASKYSLSYLERGENTLIQVWHPRALRFQLAEDVLQRLVDNNYFCVVGQHLGFMHPLIAFDSEASAALRRLRRFQDDGLILVARTSRLLHYHRVRAHLEYEVIKAADRDIIDIQAVTDPVRGYWVPQIEDLRGINFETDAARPAELRLRGKPVPAPELVSYRPDRSSAAIIGIRWFAPDLADYALPYLRAERSSYALWNPEVRNALAEQDAHLATVARSERGAAIDPDSVHERRREDAGLPGDAEVDRATASDKLGRDGRGLAHYVAAFERLGFTGMRYGLDLGSGVGYWSLAFLQHNDQVVGIERDAAKVELATRLAARCGYSAGVEFIVGRATEVLRQENVFDCAWAHAALESASAVESTFLAVARALRGGGYFYCGFPTAPPRLEDVDSLLFQTEAPERLGGLAAPYLNGYLERCGIFHTGGRCEPVLTVENLLHICRVFGLSYIGQPGIAVGGPGVSGTPPTGDFIVSKTAAPDAIRITLIEGKPVETDWRADLEKIMRGGCPGLVCDVLETVDPDAADPDNRDLYARSLIRTGRAGDRAAAALFETGGLPDLTRGLYWHDRGRIAEALSCYERLDRSHADRAFLIGCCLLRKEDWTGARHVFDRAAHQPGAGPRDHVGLFAACLRSGDFEAARQAFRAFIVSHHQPVAAVDLAPAATAPGAIGRPVIAATAPIPEASAVSARFGSDPPPGAEYASAPATSSGSSNSAEAITSQMISTGEYRAAEKLDVLCQLWDGEVPEVQRQEAVDHHQRLLLPKWVDWARYGGIRAVDRYIDLQLNEAAARVIESAAPEATRNRTFEASADSPELILQQLQKSGALPARSKIINDLVDQIVRGGLRRSVSIDGVPSVLASRLCDVFEQGALEELTYTEDRGEIPGIQVLRRRCTVFPADFVAGKSSALCVFTTAFLGKADVIYVKDAGIADVTLVDLDGAAMEAMRQIYPPHWSYIVSDYRTFLSEAIAQNRRYDVVTADPPVFLLPDLRERSLRDLLLLTDCLIISLRGPEMLNEMGLQQGPEEMSDRYSQNLNFPVTVRMLLRRGNTDSYWVVFERRG
ncbi:MAG: methyltransferase domain-containing protein [Alphaproteobacteria bacterium]|nr:methyltransferase domain-containing protein [Alphaproteobacteria bacterium]